MNNMDEIRYPIGIQTFKTIREGDYIYVDKTDMVFSIAKRYTYIFLSRPRRFGKSLLTSTFEAYFKGDKELFKGLAIDGIEKDWIRHPVFRFDFSMANYVDVSRLINRIKGDLDSIEMQYEISATGVTVAERFRKLIELTYRKFGQKVVILIDEYDKPMLDTMHLTDLHESLKAELRAFYSVIKGSDEYIRFVMITGITKFGKLSIFSGMNNLKDISLIPKYNSLCGISETEFHGNFTQSIADFAEEHDLSQEETWEKFKIKYDGYHFASRGEGIYNPYSVINAFDENELKDFWYDTGSSTFLIDLLERNIYRLDELEGQTRTESQLSDISGAGNDIIPLLFQSGYLTIKGYDKETLEYTLGFPNQEVTTAFWGSLSYHFFRGIDGNPAFNLRKCIRDLNGGHPEEFMQSMQSLFADTNSETEKNKEIHFQNMMAIAAKMMGFSVRTEVHSAKGRCDMQIITSGYVYIFEFKINGTPKEAMQQILDNGYALPFKADTRTVYLIGANFSTETRTLTGWEIRIF